MSMSDKTADKATIRQLNDRLRCHGVGNGSLFITPGIIARGKDYVPLALSAVREFENFTKDNDPHQEHDFGSFDLQANVCFGKSTITRRT